MKAVTAFPESQEVKIVQYEAPKISSPTDVELAAIENGPDTLVRDIEWQTLSNCVLFCHAGQALFAVYPVIFPR
jgi:hypothetical protein